MIPEFRRLLAHVPASCRGRAARTRVPWPEIRLFVPANSGYQCVEAVFAEREFSVLPSCGRRNAPPAADLDRTASTGGRRLDLEIEIPLRRVAIAEGVHFRKFPCRYRRAGPETAHDRRTPCGRSRSSTSESLPSNHSNATRRNRANASRKTKMLCASERRVGLTDRRSEPLGCTDANRTSAFHSGTGKRPLVS